MISSGLQIIYIQDEVNFIQNLVYYVERAYRTPDYGMWERGSKYNDGSAEIHARYEYKFTKLTYREYSLYSSNFGIYLISFSIHSSIGMAKAALEAINGCNLFGDKGSSWSVIFVDIDAHNRNRSIFETLLPRESSSKVSRLFFLKGKRLTTQGFFFSCIFIEQNIDVSLLPTISFPAFATHDEPLYTKTKEKILRKLKGEYGFRRFLRDGYKSMLEDPSRRYYLEGETKVSKH
jgi:phosphorylase kinase alpha/beta subunit